LESNLEINKLSYQIAEIQLDQAQFEAEVTRKEIQLNLEKTKISLDKAQGEIENQKRIHKEEVAQAKLKIRQLESRLADADQTIKKMTITSPGEGIAIIGKNRSTNSKWQVGDQPWSGTSLILLPDLHEMKVETEINEVDIAKISTGQQAEIQLDAFSSVIFSGEVNSVATLAKFKDRDKSKIKVFPVSVLLDSTSEELVPGMTVSCRIIIDKIESVLSVPAESVHKIGATSFVYFKSGGSFHIQEITTGLTNNDFVIVEEGLKPGDEIALAVPDKFQEEAKE
jgi:RND family efflux transporter MFP subunit